MIGSARRAGDAPRCGRAAARAGRGRPDRCPGVLRLHDARDGALARVRLPGGRLSARALEGLAAIAEQLGNGVVDLTVRANLQVRGLDRRSGGELAARLAALGLLPSAAHERARNILANPLAGRDRRALVDARPLVAAIDRALCEQPRAAALSGRFVVAVEDGAGAVAGLDHDLALAPARLLGDPAGARLALLVAGADSGLRAAPADAARLVVDAALAFLDVRPPGAWRVRDLPDGGAALAGRLTGSRVRPGAWRPAPPRPGPAGAVRQADGRIALGAVPLLGRLDPAALRALAAACRRGGGEAAISVWRTVTVLDLPPGAVAALAAALSAAGLRCDPRDGRLGLSACAGSDGCAEALADVRAAAAARAAERSGDDPPEHHSGCSRRCGEPRGPVTSVVAGADPEAIGP